MKNTILNILAVIAILVSTSTSCVLKKASVIDFDSSDIEGIVQWKDAERSYEDAANIADIAIKVDSAIKNPDIVTKFFPNKYVTFNRDLTAIYIMSSQTALEYIYTIVPTSGTSLSEAGAECTITKHWSEASECSYKIKNVGEKKLSVTFSGRVCDVCEPYIDACDMTRSYEFIVSYSVNEKAATPWENYTFSITGSGITTETSIKDDSEYSVTYSTTEPVILNRSNAINNLAYRLIASNMLVSKGVVEMTTSHTERGTLYKGKVIITPTSSNIPKIVFEKL
ncbi:MAG: hypothetical protein HUJ95_00380 [Bacteroidales bacterium]|nr:hypothetical protein [Bacteroidales bacterium]